MATVTRTIGSAQDDGLITGLRVSTVGGAGPYDLTFNHAVNYTPAIGDTVEDASNDVYIVTGVTSATVVEVTDELGVGHAPITGTCTVGRAYSSLSSAESSISTDASAGDSLIWKGMNDGTLDDRVTINDTTLGATGQLTITSPVGERHDGTAGTGFRINPSTTGTVIDATSAVNYNVVYEWLEITGFDAPSAGTTQNAIADQATTGSATVRNCILHDNVAGDYFVRMINITGRAATVRNCLMYGYTQTGSRDAIGVNAEVASTIIEHCTIRSSGTGTIGIRETISSGTVTVRNCAVFDNATNFSGTDFDGGNNATDSASAPGSSNQVSKTSANQFLRLVAGEEHFFLKRSADCVDNGMDLTGTVDDDIRGQARPQDGGHDIGAFEYGPTSVGRLIGGALVG